MRRLLAALGVAALVALGAACGGGDDDHELPTVGTEPAWLQTYEQCVAKVGAPPVGGTSPAFDECMAAAADD